MDALRQAAEIAVRDCMGVRSGESVLVILDAPKRKIGLALWEVARDLGAEAMALEIIPRTINGEEPPAAVSEMMKQVDVILAPTSKSLTHTEARRTACAVGARAATLPGITEEILIRTLNADYRVIADRSRRVAQVINGAQQARITSAAGTDLTIIFSPERSATADTGLVHEKGGCTNLPAGEAYVAPMEGKSHGILVVDGTMVGAQLLKTPIRITVRDGLAVEIEGGEEADMLREMIAPYGELGRNIAELGIGTNDKAKVTGVVLEDEKVMGTVHVALGDNASMGGAVHAPLHLDGILLRPTLVVGEIMVIQDGKLMI
ncbi:MAG: aminopeptidase [Candidatus Latescibacterota bacterium]